jgi:hypothetical protein
MSCWFITRPSGGSEMLSGTAWQTIAHCLADSRGKFLSSGKCLKQRQQDYLQALLQRHASSDIGREHGFVGLRSIDDYRKTVPLQSPQEYQERMQHLSASRPHLFAADTTFVETTGGSLGGAKVIAYGVSGLADFRKALYPWLDDLIHSHPAVVQGPAYWSISPVLRPRAQDYQGLPMSLGNDAQYFGEALVKPLLQTMAVPPAVAALETLEDWRFQTLLHLLSTPDLRLISVWSPSFILNLLHALPAMAEALCRQLPPVHAHRLEQGLDGAVPDTHKLWPHLDTLSCWTHGRAAAYLDELQRRFPQVHIQPKGLLATEGVVSIPLEGLSAPVLAADSGFFEFLDDTGAPRLAWELETGGVYEVVLSNNLGLYRYCLGDRVQVIGWKADLPLLRFLGRGDRQVDLCGEKLDDAFVSQTLEKLPGFSLLCPRMKPQPHYLCISEKPVTTDVEAALCRNPQYAYARRLEQLGSVQYRVRGDAGAQYLNWRLEQGQCLGDIKPTALLSDDGFVCYLECEY